LDASIDTNISKEHQKGSSKMSSNHDIAAATSKKNKLRKRYNKLVVIDLKKRSLLRNLIKHNTLCEHKQIYTQANAICRRISSSYEEGNITTKQAMELMLEAHNQMSHIGLPKEVVTGDISKRLDKIERKDNMAFKAIIANTNLVNKLNNGSNVSTQTRSEKETSDKYSESYWAEVI
jgi:hypothetical protein